MRKIIESAEEAEKLVRHMVDELDLEERFKVGLAGSFVRDDNKKSSKLDLVLRARTREGEVLVGKWVITDKISQFMEQHYHNKYNLIWLDLLEEDTEEILEYMRENGMELNPECVYTNIVEEVVWVTGEEVEEEEENDEYTIGYEGEWE